MLNREDVIKRHETMRSVRAPEEGDWEELCRLFAPEQSVTSGSDASRSRFADLYDSTQLYAVDNFVGGIFGQLTNPTNRWFEIGTPDPDLNAWQPVKLWLYQVSSILLSSLGPAVSAFYEEVAPVYQDMGVFGLGTLSQEEDVGKGRIIDRAIPLKQSFIATDAHGEVDRFHREFELKGEQLKGWWGPVPDVQSDRSYKIVHATWVNPKADPGRLGPEHAAVCSLYASPDLPGLERKGGYFEFPYHTVRWTKRPASPYPIGPGHRARPDVAMLQEMERSHIVAAQHAAEPPLMAHDDSVINASDIVPNAVLAGTLTDQGKQLLQPLGRASQLQLAMQQSEQRRNAIRDAFYFGLMQLMQRPQMTATEFLGFQEEKLRLMGPNLTRVQGMLSTFTARRYGILSRAGQLPPPPPELERTRLEVVYQSPLAKAQAAATARATMQIVNATMQIAAVEPEALDTLDVDAALGVLHEGFGAPPKIMRDPRLVEQRRQQRAQAQAQAVQLEQTGQAVQIAAEAAHASQAGSLARQRGAA